MLSIDAAGLVTVADADNHAQIASTLFRNVTVSDRIGSIPRSLTFSDGSVFVSDDNDAVDHAIQPFAGRGAGLVHGLERFRPRLFILVALVAALSWGLYRFALPVMVEVAVAVTPSAVPILLSKSAMASLDASMLEETGLNVDTRLAIHDAFRDIAAKAPRGRDGYMLHFRKGGPIGPNAFALPDGTIVLTDELVDLAKDDREAIIGVLAHEIGHVEHDHTLRRLYQAAGVTALVMLVAGDIGQAAEDLLIQGTALLTLSYSREQESDADRYSVNLMHASGRDPMAIVRFLELLRDKLGDRSDSDFFSTHPATVERIEETRRLAQEIADQ